MGAHRSHGKGSGKMKSEQRMTKPEEDTFQKVSSSDKTLVVIMLIHSQENQKSQKMS